METTTRFRRILTASLATGAIATTMVFAGPALSATAALPGPGGLQADPCTVITHGCEAPAPDDFTDAPDDGPTIPGPDDFADAPDDGPGLPGPDDFTDAPDDGPGLPGPDDVVDGDGGSTTTVAPVGPTSVPVVTPHFTG